MPIHGAMDARRMRAIVVGAVLVLLGAGARAAHDAGAAAGEGRATSFEVPLVHAPLDTPLVLTGGFGEYRIGHFHAGLDFGTGGRVGRPVFAPMSGSIERVRASGVGYGRSVYLRTTDGRLLVFGHLDAYAEPLASHVRAAQESTGQYEQDLWLEPGAFAVRAGQTFAWTGESGAGGPHLHFEIRRGDVAYNPLLAGLAVADESRPSLANIALEPLDDTTVVSPPTNLGGAAPETVWVRGRARAVVGARDGAWRGVDRMVPWAVRLELPGEWVECRFDSVSWATDMAEGDFIYDAGRFRGEKGVTLWAPSGFRPRAIQASAPVGSEAGTIAMTAASAPKRLRLSARDVAGQTATREIWVLPARPGSGKAAAPAASLGDADPAALPVTPAESLDTGARWGVLRWRLPAAGVFEPARVRHATESAIATPELKPLSDVHRIEPVGTALRRAATLSLELPRARWNPRAGLYRRGSDGWDWVATRYDSTRGRLEGESRRLGRYAVLVDGLAPRASALAPPSRGASTPYSRWALEARVVEEGSGVEARASFFTIDGRRVPTEWDSEGGVLRWRPAKAPGTGTHRYRLTVGDRAGNVATTQGTFRVP